MIRHERGFSLIELMIAVIIMSILLAMAVPAFTTYIANTKVRASAESLLAGLQMARSEAVRRNWPVNFARISAPAISSSFAAAPDINGGNWIIRLAPATSEDAFIEGKQGSEGDATQRVSLVSNVSDLTFNGFGGANTGATFQFSNPSAGTCASATPAGPIRCLNIVVSVGGRIRMCDPAVTDANDTRSC